MQVYHSRMLKLKLPKISTKIVYSLQYLIYIILILSSFDDILMNSVDAAPNRKNSQKITRKQSRKRRRYTREKFDFTLQFRVLGILLLAIFGPAIIGFIYTVYKDPASPQIAKGLWKYLKTKTTGYLSGTKDDDDGENGEDDDNNISSSSGNNRRKKNR